MRIGGRGPWLLGRLCSASQRCVHRSVVITRRDSGVSALTKSPDKPTPTPSSSRHQRDVRTVLPLTPCARTVLFRVGGRGPWLPGHLCSASQRCVRGSVVIAGSDIIPAQRPTIVPTARATNQSPHRWQGRALLFVRGRRARRVLPRSRSV